MTLLHVSLILVTGVSSILRTVVDSVCVISRMISSFRGDNCDLGRPVETGATVAEAAGGVNVDECDDLSLTAAFDLILIDVFSFSPVFFTPTEFGS